MTAFEKIDDLCMVSSHLKNISQILWVGLPNSVSKSPVSGKWLGTFCYCVIAHVRNYAHVLN